VLTGLCGVSGSGKSTLAIDVLARALAPPRLTTSVAYEEVAPGAHDAIEGAPPRTVVSDQTRAGIRSPGALLGVIRALRRAYAGSAEAAARGLGERDLAPSCDACHGKGRVREDMGFLPALDRPCDACDATGYRAEARELEVRGLSLPALEALTLEQVRELWADHDEVARPLATACSLGLGYLVLGQRGEALSGGEAQRLKLSHELARAVAQPTLYILDEPTVGLHDLDVARLADALDGLVGRGHGVLLVEHHPALLARCDWLLELGPGAGPDGGRVVAAGTPERIAAGATPTAPYLRAVLP
jgi:excinuclease ABC subunit A